MKKILLVTRNFPPLRGGMERLNHHIYLELNKTFDVVVAGPADILLYLSPSTRYCEFPHRPLPVFFWFSFWSTLRLAIKEKPALIISGSGITALSARLIGYLCQAKVITFIHGLDVVMPHPVYQRLFLPAIRACDAIWVNSQNTANLAINKGVCSNKIKTVYPGVVIPENNTLSQYSTDFRSELGLTQDLKILLSVGRLTERKGLVEFILYSLPDIVKACPDCILIIIGDEPNNALHHKTGAKEKITQAAKDKGLEKHVIFLGHVSEFQLEAAYQSSQLHIFPVLDLPGDIEGFGMVAIEAAVYGLPTVAFAVGGVPEAVSHHKSGWLIEPGNYPAMTETVINSLANLNSSHQTVTPDSCRQHGAEFSWDIFGDRIKQLCWELITQNEQNQ
ncbi:glycosyltransferase family 4 protein [Methylicorpusculum sp.]|uniref:glycosyltransferase family 4 protein n=1 Tax=Methylicorpusculum sp. TaxID=2713644 RepID=UPI00271B0B1C|nr:glycosyltransferase family 4 protein [Methylicorpusculum sp.]MDO8844859.1 glycosyltransferase family 4 protein [Methylicorpusculum sp.]